MKSVPSFTLSATLLLTVALAATAARAENARGGDPVRGRELSGECAACHDGDGRTRFSIYPRIAGQTYDYLLLSMREFRSKERHQAYAGVMWPSVEKLSDQDLRDLAAYYSALPW
jgi:cytochrome c553